jgi:hypothetical protein
LCMLFQSSSANPCSPISPPIPSAQVSLGLPRFLTLNYVYIIYNYMIYKYNDTREGTKSTMCITYFTLRSSQSRKTGRNG